MSENVFPPNTIHVVSCQEARYRINHQLIFFGRSADGYRYCKLVMMKRAESHIGVNPIKWLRLFLKGIIIMLALI